MPQWIGNNDPMKVEELFSNTHSVTDPDLALKNCFQLVSTTMKLLSANPFFRKTWLTMLVGMLQAENNIKGQYYKYVEPPAPFKLPQ